MSKTKGHRVLITLECGECRQNLIKRTLGVSRYLSSKNKHTTPAKLEMEKYCKYCNKHTTHKELK